MSWKEKYKVVGIRPGPVVVHGLGRIDFSRADLPEKVIEDAIAKGCPFVKRIDPEQSIPATVNKEMTVAEVVAAIKISTDKEELRYLYGKKQRSPLVKKAYYKRMEEFSHDDSAN